MLRRVLGGALEQVSEEPLGGPGGGNLCLEALDVSPHSLLPLLAWGVEDATRRVQPHADPREHLNEREATEGVAPVVPTPAPSSSRHESDLVVVAQGRGLESEHPRRLTDGDEHRAI